MVAGRAWTCFHCHLCHQAPCCHCVVQGWGSAWRGHGDEVDLKVSEDRSWVSGEGQDEEAKGYECEEKEDKRGKMAAEVDWDAKR